MIVRPGVIFMNRWESRDRTMKKIMQIIDKIRFFDGLNPVEKETIAKLDIKIFKYAAGSVVIKKRHSNNDLFFMIKGTATVTGEKSAVLAILKPGDVFGEVTFLEQGLPSTANVVTNNVSIIILLSREAFQSLPMDLQHKLKDKLMRIILQRISEAANPPADLLLSTSSFSWSQSD